MCAGEPQYSSIVWMVMQLLQQSLTGSTTQSPFLHCQWICRPSQLCFNCFQGIEKRHLWLDSVVNASSRSTDLQTKSTVLHSFQGIEKQHLWLDSAVNASSRSTGSAGQSTVLQYFQGVKARHLWLDNAVNASSRSLEPQMNIP